MYLLEGVSTRHSYIFFLILYILHLTLTVYDAVSPPWPLSCPIKKLAL